MPARTGKGGRRQPPQSARPTLGCLTSLKRPPDLSGPPGIGVYFWGAGNPARLDSVDPGARGWAPQPLSPFGHQAEGEGSGDPGDADRRSGSWGWTGAPGVGGAGGAGVNVRPAPDALTQFHQKLGGEEVADPQRTGHRGGSCGPSRAGSRDRNLGWPGPTPLT
ncbi:hypothetical protein J1605_015034 [Eschrichtius robustus]|uniref:Uncharacterized protein n=1 Tax=Eschrichtius robustus TaxID=9764 RepID=A0AB34GCN6_ESCRO|nr:hypothetical protein J1605_015034 [Eschrichtius robustus]